MGSIKRIVIIEIESTDKEFIENFVQEINSECNTDVIFKSTSQQFGKFKIDENKKQLYYNNQIVPLTKSEFDIITLLLSNPGQIFSKDQIYEFVWKESSESCTHAVENMISRLRKKIEDNPKNPQYIITVHGFGYKFKKTEN